MRQNGHCFDHASVVLLCYPPRSPALPDINCRPQHGDFFTKGNTTGYLLPALYKLVFLWVPLYDLLSIARVDSSCTLIFEIGMPAVKSLLAHLPNWTMLISLTILAQFAS